MSAALTYTKIVKDAISRTQTANFCKRAVKEKHQLELLIRMKISVAFIIMGLCDAFD